VTSTDGTSFDDLSGASGAGAHRVVHVVLVAWKADATDDIPMRAAAIAERFTDEIPGVLDVVQGPSVSPEGLEQGFEWGLVIDLADADARDGYLPHPVHRELADLIEANADRIAVFDLEAPAGRWGG